MCLEVPGGERKVGRNLEASVMAAFDRLICRDEGYVWFSQTRIVCGGQIGGMRYEKDDIFGQGH